MAKQPTEKQLAARAASAERFRKMHAEKKAAKEVFSKEENNNAGSENENVVLPIGIQLHSLFSPDGNGQLVLDKVGPGTTIEYFIMTKDQLRQIKNHANSIGLDTEKIKFISTGIINFLVFPLHEEEA